MQVGDVYEHSVRGDRIEIVSPVPSNSGWFNLRKVNSRGLCTMDICHISDDGVFRGLGYIKHPAKQGSAPPRWTVDDPIELSSTPDGMSCRYDSPKTPQEEEEDYRKRRDAIFARMFS